MTEKVIWLINEQPSLSLLNMPALLKIERVLHNGLTQTEIPEKLIRNDIFGTADTP